MKKKIIIILFLLFLALVSFGGGALLSHKNSSKNFFQKSPNINSPASEVSEEAEAINDSEENKQEFSFAILGDTQYFKPETNGSFQESVNSLKKMNPDLVFALGDLISSCDEKSECEDKYNNWKNVLGELFSKTYVAQGNHDRKGREKADSVWEKVFNKLPGNGPQGFTKFTYSFDFGNSHFIVLDSDKPEENIVNDTQRSWLEEDLSNTQKENIFVFFHEPAYPTNSKVGESLDDNEKDRDALWDIFVDHKVTAVFSGHEHIQSRRKINGVYQFVFGNTNSSDHEAPKAGMTEYFYVGHAFGLIEVNGTNITVKTYSPQGDLLDSFEISG